MSDFTNYKQINVRISPIIQNFKINIPHITVPDGFPINIYSKSTGYIEFNCQNSTLNGKKIFRLTCPITTTFVNEYANFGRFKSL